MVPRVGIHVEGRAFRSSCSANAIIRSVPGLSPTNRSVFEDSQCGSPSSRSDPGIFVTDSRYGSSTSQSLLHKSKSLQDLTNTEARQAKKAAETNARVIENRITFMQREEDKILRDLEAVQGEKARIEQGKTRMLEKKLASQAISLQKERQQKESQAKAEAARAAAQEAIRAKLFQAHEKQQSAQIQREKKQNWLQQKKLQSEQDRAANSERAVAAQRARQEVQQRVQQEGSDRQRRVRERLEAEKVAHAMDAQGVESRLADLEVEQQNRMQRLQHLRTVSQSELEKLETTLGSSSNVASPSVANLLRQKKKGLDGNPPSAKDLQEESGD